MENPQRLGLPRMPFKVERLGALVGMLLGDASIVKKYPNNLVICHSDKVKGYFDWKCDVLSHLGYKKLKVRRMEPIVKGKKYSASIVDYTGNNIHWLYEKMYSAETGKRKVNPSIIRHLNQYGLALWFMDDGDNLQKPGQYYRLNTQAYSENEQEILIRMLKKRFGLNPTIHREKGKYFKLYFGADKNNNKRLRELVSPYIHPDMEYKLRWTPKNG